MDIRSEARTFGRVLSLDAMRGAAAIVVVIYHALGVAPLTAAGGWEYWLPKLMAYAVHFGYAGVYLFFVISGFCIHLHWGRARAVGVAEPAVNFLPFWKRRVRRLYPPYLAALVLYLCHTAYVSPVKVTGFYLWDVTLHLVMLHNLDPRTCYTINGAFWTLAIEEQLYLAYFLLLFLRRRHGWARTLIICAGARVAWLVLGRSLAYFTGIEIPVSEAAATSWFTWALGALSVEAALGVVTLPRWCYQMRAAAAALLCAIGLSALLPHVERNLWVHDTGWLMMHPAWGVGFFVLVNAAVRKEQGWRRALARTPRAVKLFAPVGIISYSLYLTHLVVLMKWYWFGFLRLHILTVTLLVMTPLCLLFAWLFFRLFELPFMSPPAVAALHPSHGGASPGRVEPSSIS
jgi:peptidoglycan/LPS O-acetylase OafA/YrhL